MSITKHLPHSQYGFTLIELMLALVINMVVLFALITVFSSNSSYYASATNANTLDQQLEMAMELMVNDIRRAGYWGLASSNLTLSTNNNPFMVTGTTDVNITNNNCILFTYDYNSSGSLPAISSSSDDDRYGYRLNGTTLQTRPSGASFSCDAAANAWENVTNTSLVNITNLNFALTTTTVPVGAASNTMSIRSITISMTGQLVGNANVTKTLTEHVRIRNDKYVP